MERSAEFYRGAVEALNRAQRDFTATVPELQADYIALLAAAEAREAFPIPDTLPEVPEAREAGSVVDRVNAAVQSVQPTPNQTTAAEVIAAAEKALRCGMWESFTADERGYLAEALAIIARWKEGQHAK